MDIRQIGFTRYSRFGVNLGRLHMAANPQHVDGLDGTDTLTVTCYEDLEKNEYIVWRDRQGEWHEHIVDTPKRTHDDTGAPVTVATCINSIAETWDDYVDDKRPRGTAQVALASILVTSRWAAGACTQEGTASHTFYHMSVREALQELLETWGGELETVISCDGNKVTSREVRIVATRGNQSSAKRFTWTKDLISITRYVASDNPKSRLYAYGKGEETESGGYGRRISIDSVNDGKKYVEDAEATALWGHPMPDGTIKPSEGKFIDEECEDPETLLAEALAALEVAKVPTVAYTAEVIDLVSFGRDWEDVALGDLVTIVDKEFCDGGLRLKGRVSRLERDLFTYETKVTFGNLADALTTPYQSMQGKLASLNRRSTNWDIASNASPDWLETLISNLNAAYNQAGTYHYSSFEQGEIWSNVPLDEFGQATKSGGWAMNINGMGFRLASGTNADGSWNWRTFGNGNGFSADYLNAGEINANLIKTVNLKSGTLTGRNDTFLIDLDNGVVEIGSRAKLGDKTVQEVLQGVDATITNVKTDVEYAKGASATVAPASGWSTDSPTWEAGKYIWQRTKTSVTTAKSTTTTTSDPACISGREGNDGTGIKSIVEQYYLSDSDTAQKGGSWGTSQPTWSSGKYVWTRSLITWDTTPESTTTTAPVLANTINGMSDGLQSALDGVDTLNQQLGEVHTDLLADIEEARKVATDYMTYANGELTIGVSSGVVRNVIGATRQVYRTNAGDIAGFGMFGDIWKMFIGTATVQDRLEFGDFAWITRANGNMTLKWTGA